MEGSRGQGASEQTGDAEMAVKGLHEDSAAGMQERAGLERSWRDRWGVGRHEGEVLGLTWFLARGTKN